MGLLRHRLLGSTPRVSDSVSLEKDPRIFISHKFSDMVRDAL